MTVDLLERPAPSAAAGASGNGGVPARRAMVRWAWRLFRREWRQQLLILALIIVAVAATIVGAAVATNTPPPPAAGFGTAGYVATLQGSGPQLAANVATLEHRVGRVEVIENETLSIPGSINTFDLRAQNPHGPFGQPMLDLVSGHYPTGPDQVALTAGVASGLNLKIGDVWHHGGSSRSVVGIVQNPQSLLDEFALVVPGQVTAPTQTTVLFNGSRSVTHGLARSLNIEIRSSASTNPLNPETIVLALATVGMLLVALVAVGGFTVLAQRRLRSIGMLGALGATDKHLRLVMRANGVVVGIVGSVLGAALGLVAWLAYRPHVEASSHHLIGMFALPWVVVAAAMVLAVVATYFAASRPARAVTRISIVSALSGRPAPPKQVHRSAVPGVIVGVIAFFLLGSAASSGGHGGGSAQIVFGLVALIVAVLLLSPLCLAVLARVARRSPIAVRLAVRDLARYRARSGSALAAISVGVLIAVIICVLAASRYGNVLDYAGPNLESNQLVVYTPQYQCGPRCQPTGGTKTPSELRAQAAAIAAPLGTRGLTQLDTTSATLQHADAGRQFSGSVYVATPQLLHAFGISPSSVDPSVDILTARPGFASISDMQLVYGNYFGNQRRGPGPGGPNAYPCPKSDCLANPKMQQVSALPSGTSAPNTVITEHAVHQLHLQVSPTGWLIQTAHPLTAAQINNAQQSAATAGMTVETKNDQPTSSEIINWATVFGILLALGVLAMTVGLIRSETASDLRILTATGASSGTRRSLTGATAGALALLGAVLGTVAGYVATIAYARSSSLDGLSSLGNIPAKNLLIILVGMPLVAAAGGWLLAGREPSAIALQPMD